MRRTLVVVDMQIFENPPNLCADRVVKLIRMFRTAGDPIIILEYRGSGSTISPVMDAVEGYNSRIIVEKECYDGSKEMLEVCEPNGWPLDFLLCGVSHRCCVKHTADALAWMRYPVEVALDCTDAGDNEWEGGSLVEVTRRFEEAA